MPYLLVEAIKTFVLCVVVVALTATLVFCSHPPVTGEDCSDKLALSVHKSLLSSEWLAKEEVLTKGSIVLLSTFDTVSIISLDNATITLDPDCSALIKRTMDPILSLKASEDTQLARENILNILEKE